MTTRLPLGLKFLFHQGLAALGKKTWKFPWGVYLYLTYRCNLHCSYCDNGSGHKFPELRSPELSPDQWKAILETLAPHSDVLLLSGGEPLLYEGLPEVIRHARQRGFTFISLNTNGLLLTEEIISAVDAIIISLDSLDRQKSDRLWNREGASEAVIQRLIELSRRPHPSLMVNSVILPDNLDDIAAVMEFCHRYGITFSTGPALDKTRPYAGLKGSPGYLALMKKILEAKRRGWKIAATVDYLRGVARFEPFSCNPQLVWRVHPDGTLVYPCSRRNEGAGNLLTTPDPEALFRKAFGDWTMSYMCDEHCPLSCYMDTSYMIQRPLGLIREGFYRFRTFSRGHRLVY